jgi:small subunit ribosomal protein S20
MANIKSQVKRNRQNEVRHERNKSAKSDIKTSIRKLDQAIAAGEPTDDLYRSAQSKIDTAVSKGMLKKNSAARKKSRLATKVTPST